MEEEPYIPLRMHQLNIPFKLQGYKNNTEMIFHSKMMSKDHIHTWDFDGITIEALLSENGGNSCG